jgi:endonuclease/exonuclease/phosphatase family metal-dependent hydrolase
VLLSILTWNLYHGRDFPPDPALLTWRSRVFRITERNDTHVQVNRDLLDEFTQILANAKWDVALLQECPPRWSERLAEACGAEAHRVLTARNSFGWLRATAATLNPDLIASNEGGSNLILVRPRAGAIVERRELLLRERLPERRTMAFTRLASGVCVSNLHASAGRANLEIAERELLFAAERSVEWADNGPLILGGDLNVRPRDGRIYEELERRFGLRGPTAPDSLDHLLARGLEVVEPPRHWPPDGREVAADGLALRLSDHGPVEAVFGVR